MAGGSDVDLSAGTNSNVKAATYTRYSKQRANGGRYITYNTSDEASGGQSVGSIMVHGIDPLLIKMRTLLCATW